MMYRPLQLSLRGFDYSCKLFFHPPRQNFSNINQDENFALIHQVAIVLVREGIVGSRERQMEGAQNIA